MTRPLHRIRCVRGSGPVALAVPVARLARVAWRAAVALAFAGGVSTAWGQTPAPGPSLDELLGLDPGPTVSDAQPDSDSAPASPAGAGDRAADPAAHTGAPAQPIADAAAQMERAAVRLDTSRDAGLATQRLQEDVLARLDQLIADAINNAAPPPPSGGGQGSGSGTPDNGDAQPQAGQEPDNGDAPAPGSSAAASGGADGSEPSGGGFSPGQVGPAGPEAGPLREIRTEWGTLPPRLRDALSNGLDEPFSPVYRRQTEAFYRRLAQDAAQ